MYKTAKKRERDGMENYREFSLNYFSPSLKWWCENILGVLAILLREWSRMDQPSFRHLTEINTLHKSTLFIYSTLYKVFQGHLVSLEQDRSFYFIKNCGIRLIIGRKSTSVTQSGFTYLGSVIHILGISRVLRPVGWGYLIGYLTISTNLISTDLIANFPTLLSFCYCFNQPFEMLLPPATSHHITEGWHRSLAKITDWLDTWM